MESITHDERGWYFPMVDCRIGPYREEGECRVDYERWMETGRISVDPVGKVGVSKCSECEEKE